MWGIGGRSPCGERGLKPGRAAMYLARRFTTLSVREAWIETSTIRRLVDEKVTEVAPRAGSVD